MPRREPVRTGIRGQIVLFPQWPLGGVNARPRPSPQSLRGSIRIETVSDSKLNPGTTQLVALVDTNAQGKFSAELAAGRYVVTAVQVQPGYPTPKPATVEVKAGVVTYVDAILDTGIR